MTPTTPLVWIGNFFRRGGSSRLKQLCLLDHVLPLGVECFEEALTSQSQDVC